MRPPSCPGLTSPRTREPRPSTSRATSYPPARPHAPASNRSAATLERPESRSSPAEVAESLAPHLGPTPVARHAISDRVALTLPFLPQIAETSLRRRREVALAQPRLHRRQHFESRRVAHPQIGRASCRER